MDTPSFSYRYDGAMRRRPSVDAATGLKCECELTKFPESAASEWLIRFRNTGDHDTPILEDVQALDLSLPCSAARVYFSKGARGAIDDFMLQEQIIGPDSESKLVSREEGSSREHLPFFNLDTGGQGVLIAIGWTGHWACSFERRGEEIRIRAGMLRTHLRLHPGEEIRTPRILLLPWKGDRQQAHNLLRRHLLAQHIPNQAPLGCLTWGGMKTHNHLKLIDFIREHRLPYDYYWIDAGWYGPDHATEEFQNFHTEDWAYHVGHWRVNRTVHPDGLKPIVDAAHAAGMKVLLWGGPTLAEENSPLVREHPEWMIRQGERGKTGIGGNPKPVRIFEFNLGIPTARRHLGDLFSDLIREQNVDCFRDDCGIPVGEDAPDRQGMSEIQCVTGLYEFWDDLRQRRPQLLLDNCGGGASRVDLETISRGIVLWRSDYNCSPDASPIGSQVGSHGLSHWVPLIGGAPPARPGDTYNFRSSWNGGIPFGLFHPAGPGSAPTAPIPDYPIVWHRQMMEQYRRFRKYFMGDFYPLTPCTLSPQDWFAYRMDRPDLGEGVVLAFRREQSPVTTMEFPLTGGEFEIENIDTGERSHGQSMTVMLNNAPGSALFFYRKK